MEKLGREFRILEFKNLNIEKFKGAELAREWVG